ncbi:DNA-3-methyladenine glycosylase isoform X4 [Macaca fascicularis]|uniref:DNA-3-methyladenine glycosylase isoform X4 n=1 Tax=Macaca fascicularis TaxID=9541 RepID=UPI003D1562D0
MPARSGAQFSRRMGQKKQRLAKAEQPHSPSDTAQAPCPKEPCLGPPTTLGPYRSIYFSSPKGHLTRLGLEFFDQPAVPLARAFLGQVLVRRLPNGTELRGRIVETEAYLGPEDEAAHSRGGRQTPRNRGMFMKPGTLGRGLRLAASTGAPGRSGDHASASQHPPERHRQPCPQGP